MGEIFDIYNIIFLVLAVVILLRLRSVLGRRTGNERRPPADPFARRQSGATPGQTTAADLSPVPRDGVAARPSTPASDADEDAPASLGAQRIARIAQEGTPLRAGLNAILAADSRFDPEQFLSGARAAYEMIVTAFAAGERKALKPLLSRDVFDGFAGAISEREARGEKIEQTFVGIGKAEIVEAAVIENAAQLTIRFESQLISVTRGKDDAIVAGDPAAVSDIVDRWTFARDVTQRDPNWKLVSTQSVE